MSNRRHSTWRKITDDEVVMKAMKNIRAKYLSNQLDIQLIAQDTHLAGSTLRGHFLYPERCTVRSYLMFQKLLGLPEYVPNRKLSPADAQPTRRVSTQGETPITD
ncbi:MAG: hypothetical protein IJS28_11905, partial [Synergistaceae bacterium]|nr:hypothetical protein [Synergistaceae bacterium]